MDWIPNNEFEKFSFKVHQTISDVVQNTFYHTCVTRSTNTFHLQVIIEAERGLTYHGDISIDDISFSPQCYPSEGKTQCACTESIFLFLYCGFIKARLHRRFL